MKEKEIIPQLAIQNTESDIVLKITDSHISDCAEQFKMPPQSHPSHHCSHAKLSNSLLERIQ